MKHDWEPVRKEYVESSDAVTHKSLAEKYSIPIGTISKRAKRKGWMRERLRHRISQTPVNASEDASEEGVDWQELEDRYIYGNDMITHQYLADKYHIPANRISKHAAKYQWTQKRNGHRQNISEKRSEMAEEFAFKTMEQINKEDLTILENYIARALQGIVAGAPVQPSTGLSAMQLRRKIYEKILGIDHLPDQVFDMSVDVSLGEIVTALRALREEEEREEGTSEGSSEDEEDGDESAANS